MRKKYLVMLLLIILLSAAFFVAADSMISNPEKDIEKVDKKIKQKQEILNSAKVLNEELAGVSKVIENSITTEHKYTPEEVNAFVKKISDLADELQIAVVNLKPLENYSASGSTLLEQQYNMELKTTYVQLGQFLSAIESFDNILSIKTLEVKPIRLKKSGKAATASAEEITRYTVVVELLTYKIVKEG